MDIFIQVVATLLSVGAAFIAAYLIYLFSAQSNVDQEIQVVGSQIAESLKKSTRTRIPFFDGYPLIKVYLEKHPDKTRVDALMSVAAQLLSASIFQQEEEKQKLFLFEKTNGKGPYIGRIFFWLMGEFIYELAPEIAKAYPIGFSRRIDSFREKRSELFPLGPLGVERWSEDCTAILNAMRFLLHHKEVFLKDIEGYISGLDLESKNWWQQFEWKEILKQLNGLVSDLRIQNEHLRSLIRLKNNYSIYVRFPHAKRVIIFWLLSFLVGVLLPTLLIALKLEGIFGSARWHIGYVSITFALTFLFLSLGIIYVGKDILLPYKLFSKKEFLVRSALPLQKRLKEDDKQEFAEYDYLLVNKALKEKFLTEEKKLRKELEAYRQAVVDSNTCSREIARALSKALKESKLLEKFKINSSSGGTSLNLFDLLYRDRKKRFLSSIKHPNKNIIFEIRYFDRESVAIEIKLPKQEDEAKKIISDMEILSEKVLGKDWVKACLRKRDIVKRERKKLLRLLSKITEND